MIGNTIEAKVQNLNKFNQFLGNMAYLNSFMENWNISSGFLGCRESSYKQDSDKFRIRRDHLATETTGSLVNNGNMATALF